MHLPNNSICNVFRTGADAVLRTLNPTFRWKGFRFKVRSLTQISAIHTFFTKDFGYDPCLHRLEAKSICDLGCNAGLFPIWLALQSPISMQGLMIDANEAMVDVAIENIRLNAGKRFWDFAVIAGLVGDDSGNVNISPSDQSSSTDTPPWMDTRVTSVSWMDHVEVASEWRLRFGRTPCDLMKIDIEGSEGEFITKERDFLRNSVKYVVVEWHEPRTTKNRLIGEMSRSGFKHVKTGNDDGVAGVLYFSNLKF